jgi:dihydropteroate synthase
MIKSINCRGQLLEFDSPKVMGILNYTPDSFSDGGKYNTLKKALTKIEDMFADGADIIDIGAISSRPGSDLLNIKEEKQRLEPLLKEIDKNFPKQIFSLDTFRSYIAEWAVNEFNISIINDISAGELDAKMFETIGRLQVPYIMMHMQGTPDEMQREPSYENVTQDIIQYLAKKVAELKKFAVHDILIDPGFGFGKTIEHNYQLLNELESFKIFDNLLLVGLSRKSMIQKVLDIDANQALNGTTILNTLALEKGANILRVHDVKEAKEIVTLFNKMSSI